MDSRIVRAFVADDGRLEAALGIVLLISAAGVAAVYRDWPTWPLLAAGGFLIWAMLLAPHNGVRAVGVVLAVAVGLFIGDVEMHVFVACLSFLVLEILILTGRWVTGAVTGLVIFTWFVLGDPLAAWGVSAGAEVLTVLLCIVVALVVGLARRMLRMERRGRQSAVELERLRMRVDMARELHDNVADSLTRIVLLSGTAEGIREWRPRVHEEAQEAIASLRSIIGHLQGEGRLAGSQSVVDLGVDRAVGDMQALGLHPVVDFPGVEGVRVVETVARALREVFTNVLKYGENPVRLLGEVSGGMSRVLVVNRISADHRDDLGGTGRGLPGVEAAMSEVGGTVEVSRADGLMQVALEFPVVEAG